MELTQLKYFQAMAKCHHFTQAAEEMAVSQSALSRSIQKLEQELGVTLFERHGRTSELTEAGQKFLFHVDRVIRELALAEQEIELDNGGAGVVHLSFLHSLGDTFLPLILRQFHERYPHIDVKLNQQNSSMLSEQLTSGETDICLCSTMNEPDTAWMYLWSEEMFLVVPEDHPLAQKSRVNLREIEDEPFVALKPEYTLRQQVNQFLDLAESHPQIVFEGDEVHTLVSFVAAHLGVSPALLALRFRQRTHTTVREAIIRARLKEVEKLLSSTQQPVARIARSCGFSTANRLTHLFTARYGLSPRAWRAR